MTEELRFRELLLNVQDSLSKEDRIRLHFLFGDVLPRRLRDDPSINGTLNLLELLIDQGKISEQDFQYLIIAFEKIDRPHVARRLRAHAKKKQLDIREGSILLEQIVDDRDEDKVLSFNNPPEIPIPTIKINRRSTFLSHRKQMLLACLLFFIVLFGGFILFVVFKVTTKKTSEKSNEFFTDHVSQHIYRGKTNSVIVGYYTSWSIYERKYFVWNIPAEKITHLNYASAGIDDDGRIALLDVSGDIGTLSAEKHQHLRTLINIAGQNNSVRFSFVASNAKNRLIFAESCVKFLEKYPFDGIDLGWQFFVSDDASEDNSRLEDKENYVLLVQELRRQLDQTGKTYLLTIQGSSIGENIKKFNLPQMIPYVDWINVFTMDFTGYWNAKTGHHSALYRNSQIFEDSYEAKLNCDAAIQAYLDAGLPSRKLVMGIPLYGHGWQEVIKTDQNGFRQQASPKPLNGSWGGHSTFDYDHLKKDFFPTYGHYFDKESSAPYLFNPSIGNWISYEDLQSINAKAKYIKDRRLRGAYLWELSCDRQGELINATFQALISNSAFRSKRMI